MPQSHVVNRAPRRVNSSMNTHRLTHIHASLSPSPAFALRSQAEGLEYHGRRRAAQDAGDFFDFISRSAGTLAVAVGAVSPHGLESALMSSSLETLLFALTAQPMARPASIVQSLNRSVCRACADNFYAPLFCAWVDPLRRELCYVNAGHEPALLLRKRQNRAIALESTGAVLGLTDRSTYGQRAIPLEPGDLLAVFSSGIAESSDILGHPFGSAGVLEVLRRFPRARAADLVDEVLDAAERHAGWGLPSMDQTVAVVRLIGSMEEAVPAEAGKELSLAAA